MISQSSPGSVMSPGATTMTSRAVPGAGSSAHALGGSARDGYGKTIPALTGEEQRERERWAGIRGTRLAARGLQRRGPPRRGASSLPLRICEPRLSAQVQPR